MQFVSRAEAKKMKVGDIVKYTNNHVVKVGMILGLSQVAWGAKRYKILFQCGTIKYVWQNKLSVV